MLSLPLVEVPAIDVLMYTPSDDEVLVGECGVVGELSGMMVCCEICAWGREGNLVTIVGLGPRGSVRGLVVDNSCSVFILEEMTLTLFVKTAPVQSPGVEGDLSPPKSIWDKD